MTNRTSVRRQRWLALLIPGGAALIAVGAFYLARWCGCDERGVTLATMAAGALAILVAVAR